MPKVFCFT